MISRPKTLEIIKARLEFNFQIMNELEIDLEHINKNGRSYLGPIEVLNIVNELINETVLYSSDIKKFGDEMCTYYVKKGHFSHMNYKIVFCICSDKPRTIGVITLHRQ